MLMKVTAIDQEEEGNTIDLTSADGQGLTVPAGDDDIAGAKMGSWYAIPWSSPLAADAAKAADAALAAALAGPTSPTSTGDAAADTGATGGAAGGAATGAGTL